RRPDSVWRRRTCRTSAEGASLFVLNRLLHVEARVVRPGWNVEEAGLWTIRRVVPVRAALVAGQNQRTLRGWRHFHNLLGPAFGVESARPVHFNKRLTEQELTGSAIEHVEESVAVRPQHDLSRASLPLHIDEDRDLSRIVVELIMRRKLVMPFQLS